MKSILLAIAIAASSLLSACTDGQVLEDVSGRPEYKQIVGSRYEVVGKLEAYGVGENPYKRIEYVLLMPVYGYTGSEIGFDVPVQPGSKVTVTHVYRSIMPFSRSLTLGVQLQGTDLPVEAPVRIILRDGNEGKSPVSLNPDFYKKI